MSTPIGNVLLPPGVEAAQVQPLDVVRLVEVMVRSGLSESWTKAGRLIKGGAVSVEVKGDGCGLQRVPRELNTPALLAGFTYVIKVGKRRWAEVTVKREETSDEQGHRDEGDAGRSGQGGEHGAA